MLHINEEATRCLLCYDAPCGGTAARAIRAARFDNLWTAVELFNSLSDEELAHAEASCIHYDKPIRIAELAKAVRIQPSAVGVAFAGTQFLRHGLREPVLPGFIGYLHQL